MINISQSLSVQGQVCKGGCQEMEENALRDKIFIES
jgi:hypothetical protein